jgi:hypothetical protein
MRLNTKLTHNGIAARNRGMRLFVLNQYSQNDRHQEIQESSRKSQGNPDKRGRPDIRGRRSLTTERPLKEAKKRGITEVNIINNEGEIINSSDPARSARKRCEKVRKRTQGVAFIP